ncbi:MAG: hypothetical protein ACRDFX_02790 [Chloroflexota bacterium]
MLDDLDDLGRHLRLADMDQAARLQLLAFLRDLRADYAEAPAA